MVLPLLDASHYLACIEKGIALCQRLETFETATPARRVPLDAYDCTSARLSCRDEGLARGLASVGIGRAFIFVDVRNRRRQEDAIYSNWFSDGTIVAGENYKRRDENPEGQRIFPSEALWQSLLLARGQRPLFRKPMQLRTVVRSNVVNSSSRTAIWHATRRSTCSNEGPKGYKVYTELDDGYYAVLGSQNGASTMRILLDHKAQIGFRTVEKIIVFECRNVGDEENEDLARNFAVILSDPRQKDYRTVPSRIPRLVSRKT